MCDEYYALMFGNIDVDYNGFADKCMAQCTGCKCNCMCSCSGGKVADYEWESL